MSESAEVLKIRCNALEKYCIELKKELESAKNNVESTKKELKSLQEKYNNLLKDMTHSANMAALPVAAPADAITALEKDEEMVKIVPSTSTSTPTSMPTATPPKISHKVVVAPAKKQCNNNGCTSCGAPITGYNTTSYWDCSLGRHVTKPSNVCGNCDRSSIKLF